MVVTALAIYLLGQFNILDLNPNYWGLPIAASMLVVSFILIYVLDLSLEDLGLQFSKETLWMHILAFCLLGLFVIVSMYLVGFKSVMDLKNMGLYSLLFFTVAAIADELYFRGIIYRLLQTWDEKTALFGSSLIYGIWTIPVGYIEIFVTLHITSSLSLPLGPMERIVFALALGSIRYSSRMIYLAIPAHIMINMHNYIFVAADASAEIISLSYILLLVIIALLIYITYLIDKKNAKLAKS